MKRTVEELVDADVLCDFCPLSEGSRGVHCYGGQPVMCEGSLPRVEAYKGYLATLVECLVCKELIEDDDDAYKMVAADDEVGPICAKCMDR